MAALCGHGLGEPQVRFLQRYARAIPIKTERGKEMSIYYRLRCADCKEQGGFFSRQAWGWGNGDVIENTVFLMAHADCFDKYQGDEDDHDRGIQILSEYDPNDDNDEERLKWIDNLLDSSTRAGSAFPRASEWEAAKEYDIRQWWEEEKLRLDNKSLRERVAEKLAIKKAHRDMAKHLENQLHLDIQARAEECVAGGGHYWNTEAIEMGIGTNGYNYESKICTTCGLTDTGAMIQ